MWPNLHLKSLLFQQILATRLSTVKRGAQILVLEGGVIVESGTHQTLLDLGGAYRKLFDLQIYG